MTSTLKTLGIIVQGSSDFGKPTVKIACKADTYDFDAENLHSSVKVGDWVACRLDGSEVIEVAQTKRSPLRTRVDENRRVQVFSYCTVPTGHCAARDEYNEPTEGKVWSPHLSYAFSEDEVMFGLKDEILYEAWFEYNDGRMPSDPIWKLAIVGAPVIDPSKTIMLAETPWKIATASEMYEEVGTSLSAVLHADTMRFGRFHTGMIIALMLKPDLGVIIHSPSYGGVVIADAKNQFRTVYDQLEVGKIVKFREVTDSTSNKKYPEIKEVLNTTLQDIQFQVKKDQYQAWITLKTSIGIDDDLLKEEETGIINILCQYGQVTVTRENFAKQMDGVLLERNDLIRAKKEGKELPVWIRYVPVSSTWNLTKIDSHWDL